MKLFDSFNQSRKIKKRVIEKIDADILNACDDDRIDVDEVVGLMDARRKVQLNGNEQGIAPADVLKVVANVAIVGVMIGFEMSHILNQKGSRFVKAL